MTEKTVDSVQNDELYQEMLRSYQQGDWQRGDDALSSLIEKYPLDHELRRLMHDMRVRSNINKDERQERRSAAFKRTKNILLRVSLAVVIIVSIYFVFSRAESWLVGRQNAYLGALNRDRQTIELNLKFSTALQFLNAYRPDEAEALLDEIKDIDPDYEELDDVYQIVEWQQGLNELYDRAMELKKAGNYNDALLIFEAIEEYQPRYRDVLYQKKEIQREFTLTDSLDKAKIAINLGNWDEAITYLKDIRNLDLSYEKDNIDDMLYLSYINLARDILEGEPASVDALLDAREYYNKALAIHPQNAEVLEELQYSQISVADRLFTKYMELAQEALYEQDDSIIALNSANEYYEEALKIKPDDPTVLRAQLLAKTYIEAANDMVNEHWSPAITKLLFIYEQDAGYASGTAAQMLYDAYIARGDNFLFTGKARSALDDYQEAAAISERDPESLVRRFEVQVRIGDVYGVIGNYENAVYQYRAALELANIDENVIDDTEVAGSLVDADSYVRRQRFESAYRLYNIAIPKIIEHFQTYTHVVQSGDYLSQLANEYQTTLSAILEANGISDPDDISIGARIIIPVIP